MFEGFDRHAPLVIGGVGGSGSRVLVRIAIRLGRYMGARRNEPQEDALEFAEFDYRWAPPYLLSSKLPPADLAEMARDLNAVCRRHLDGIGGSHTGWGWKHSPSAHLLPFLNCRFPRLRFLHIIRDGRDIAFGAAGGRTHVLRLGGAVLDGDPTPVTPSSPAWKGSKVPGWEARVTPTRQASFWSHVNLSCASYGEEHLGSRYLRVRLEDLCGRPGEAVEEISRFVRSSDLDAATIEAAAGEVESPASIGRWRDRDPAELAAVLDVAGHALEHFGYR